jgi:hypothetical protein
MSIHDTASSASTALTDPPPNGPPSGRTTPTPSLPPAPPSVRTRRRPGMLAAGIALVAVGALGAAYLAEVVGQTMPVVAVARDVPAGQVIERADLTVAEVSSDPALSPIPAAALTGLVGQRAAVALTAGSLLTDAAVTDQLLPTGGQSLVGVALTTSQLPAQPLRAGDRIRIVDTPVSQGEPPATTPASIAGLVVSVSEPDQAGVTVVDVTVPSARAADLAARVATGRIALVLDSRAR